MYIEALHHVRSMNHVFVSYPNLCLNKIPGNLLSAGVTLPERMEITALNGEQVALLALFAENTGNISSTLGWIIAPGTTALKGPGRFEVIPAVLVTVELVVIVVVVGHDLSSLVKRKKVKMIHFS